MLPIKSPFHSVFFLLSSLSIYLFIISISFFLKLFFLFGPISLIFVFSSSISSSKSSIFSSHYIWASSSSSHFSLRSSRIQYAWCFFSLMASVYSFHLVKASSPLAYTTLTFAPINPGSSFSIFSILYYLWMVSVKELMS